MRANKLDNGYYLILAGGVGAAKFIEGLANVVDPKLLKIVVNTGDDIELFGLKICPDLDIITYTLANIIDKEKGWGFINETFNCLSVLKKFYQDCWFNAGDKDLATHIFRTDLFKAGYTKSEITQIICDKLGVKSQIFPMCNESVKTFIKTDIKEMHFEEYFIRFKCEPEIIGIELKGIKKAKPIKDVVEYVKNAKQIIICPSNPIVSIGTILQVKGIREALKKVKNKVFGISPIIKGATVKGPADKLMKFIGLDVSCLGVAKYYCDFLGNFVIDQLDNDFKAKIEEMGIRTFCFDTLMTNLDKKKNLARFVINLK